MLFSEHSAGFQLYFRVNMLNGRYKTEYRNKMRWLSIDRTVFESIIAPYEAEIRTYCFRLTNNRWDGEDLHQDGVLNAACPQ
jgi:hypothetical protein